MRESGVGREARTEDLAHLKDCRAEQNDRQLPISQISQQSHREVRRLLSPADWISATM